MNWAARANNPLLPPHLYKPEEPNRWLMALDLNNLYNVCMSSYLPIRDFKWMDDENDQDSEWHHLLNNPTQWIMAQRQDQDIGYTLEVDLSFPDHIHDKLKGLTPVPYQRKVDWEELSPLQQEFAEKLQVTDSCLTSPRLMTDLYPRKNYVVHYRVLQLYISLGIQVDKVHRAISLHQAPVLKDFLQKLTNNRKKAEANIFAQNLWKLFGNSCYGKTVESLRNRCRFIIVRDNEKAMRYNKKNIIRL